MVKKTIKIDGKDVEFAASASIPRLYRLRFRRDIFRDISKIEKSVKEEEVKKKKAQKEGEEIQSEIPIEDLEMFENVSFIMAEHAAKKKGESFPDNIEDWLDEFNTFSIYQVFPEIIKLWNMNYETMENSKKNFDKVAAK